MSVYSVLPATNLTFTDVKDTLNANGGSVGYKQSDFFSEKANINKWSKYKPMPITTSTDPDGDWYKGSDLKYGIKNFPSCSIYTDLPTMYENIESYYTYTPPSAPYGMMCYRHYYPGATNPVLGITHSDTISNGTTSNNLTISLQIAPDHPDGYNITVNDLFGGLGYYFGCYVKKQSGTQIGLATGDDTIANSGNAQCQINFNGFALGTYKIYPFFSTGKITQGSAPGSMIYYPLPIPTSSAVGSVECAESGLIVSVSIYWKNVYDTAGNVSTSLLVSTFSITNKTGGSITCPKLYLTISTESPVPYLTDTEIDDYLNWDSKYSIPRPPGFPYVFGSVTIGVNQTYTMDEKEYNGTDYNSGGYWLLYLGNSVYTEYRGFIAPKPPLPSS